MRTIRFLTVCLVFLVALIGQVDSAPLTLQHQGRLLDNTGTPISGPVSLTFKLYTVATGGTEVWSETHNVTAEDGIFQAKLGSTTPLSSTLFSDTPPAIYLGITVGTDSELSPRSELSSSPFSLNAASVKGFSSGPNNINTGLFSTVGGDNNTNNDDFSTIFGEENEVNITEFADTTFDTTGLMPLRSEPLFLHPPGSGTILGGHANTVCGNHAVIVQGWQNFNCAPYSIIGTGFRNRIFDRYSTISTGLLNDINVGAGYSVIGGGALNRANAFTTVIGGGAFNTTSAGFRGQTIGGGWRNSTDNNYSTISGGEGNAALNTHATVGGGQLDTAFGAHSTVAGGQNNFSDGPESFIGGGSSNRAEGQASTIGGGNGNLTVQHDYQFIGGGQGNRASGPYATIGGGQANEATTWATVGGGVFNHALNEYTFIGGGIDNLATGFASVVDGGSGNLSSGDYSTVPGGFDNRATGHNSFAAGSKARADDSCSFVWADCCIDLITLAPTPLYSSLSNSFNARATNGFYFMTSCDSTFDPAAGVGTGVYIPSGGSMWMTGSSRSLKKNITLVDENDILDRIEQMPVYRWSYKNQGDDVEHIGPMAEDFYESFNLGDNNRTIGSLDPAGVTLAATKALIKENQDLKDRLERLEKMVEKLSNQN